jgi:hypothetical protein
LLDGRRACEFLKINKAAGPAANAQSGNFRRMELFRAGYTTFKLAMSNRENEWWR